MRITAKTDYAVRAMVELAATPGDAPIKADQIAVNQHIPLHFLLKILADLRIARLVTSWRGQAGGYRLARPASEISVADVIRAVEGPLADVHGQPPENVEYGGAAVSVRDVWLAVRASLRSVLEDVSLEQVAAGDLPTHVLDIASHPGADRRR